MEKLHRNTKEIEKGLLVSVLGQKGMFLSLSSIVHYEPRLCFLEKTSE